MWTGSTHDTHAAKHGPWAEGGAWMEALRRGQRITQAELAEQVGAPSAAWIAEIEAGRRPVPSALYRAFARQFGLEAGAFAARCLAHYDPKAHEALFGAAAPSRAAAAPPAAETARHAA